MISKDQPAIFPPHVAAGVSSVEDGNMKYIEKGLVQLEVDENRSRFLGKLGIRPDQTVLIQTTYEGEDYNRYRIVDENHRGQGIVKPVLFDSDSLATEARNVALFLPIADCIGAILYDPANQAIMVAHLGRQHTEQHGAAKSVEFMSTNFGTKPGDLLVWVGPAPSEKTYPLFSFANRSLHDVNVEQLRGVGVNLANITVCQVDTTIDTGYFSHSEFLKGNRETDGRYAVAAMLK